MVRKTPLFYYPSLLEETPQMSRPGPKIGEPHSGQFKQGFDSNRHIGSTWDQKKQAFQQLCKAYSPAAADMLNKIMTDSAENTSNRLAAIELLLAYAEGKPVDRSIALQLDGALGGADVAGLSNDALQRLQWRPSPIPINGQVVAEQLNGGCPDADTP